MSQDLSDVPSDGDCEELNHDSFRFSEDFLEKKTGPKRAAKPPPSPKSPYLTSLNLNPRRAAVAAWRLPRASLGGSREGSPGEREAGPGRPLSLGNDFSPLIRADCAASPELFRKNLRKQQRLLQSSANGFPGCDFRDKEDMYEEILHLKKILNEQKCDNRQLKVKMRRLEEENVKRERQIQELLDPSKEAEFARSLVDNKRGGSVVVNGLKQRILKLEQQCREKESALSKLQSDLRSTNLEELKITVETYSEEIQRLRILLDAAEKRSAAECKTFQRQQRALNSSVQRLSDRNQLLLQENQSLVKELSTEAPGLTGYKEWSRKRLLRRVLELETRPEQRQRPAPWPGTAAPLDRQTQTAEAPLAMATEAGVSVATMTEEGEGLQERLGQWEQERAELQEALRRWEEELVQEKTRREKHEKEMEQWKAEQTMEREKETQQHRQEMEVLWSKLQMLEEERERSALAVQEKPQETEKLEPKSGERRGPETPELEPKSGERRGPETPELEPKSGERRGPETPELELERRERAARVIQRHWRRHRDRDLVLLQSALRGHLQRDAQLKLLLQAAETQSRDGEQQTNGLLDLESLVLIQSALRGHLTRSGQSSGSSESTGVEINLSVKHQPSAQNPDETEPVPRPPPNLSSRDSDDSDDIIVSPSRPIRRPEVQVA